MKKVLLLGVGGFALWWVWHQNQKTNTSLGIPAANGSAGTSPAKAGARVDNANQPWYVGATSAMTSKAQDYQKDPTLALKDGQTVIHAASDVWGTVSGWFSGDSGSKGSADDAPQTDTETTELPNSADQQSNILGAQIGNFDTFEPEPIMTTADADSVDWTLDYSDSNGIGSDNSDDYSEVS